MAQPGNWWGTVWTSSTHDALDGVAARLVVPHDLGFLQFLAMQFNLQHRYYQEHHAGADFLLLSRANQPIGRLYRHERDRDASLIDISLVPADRGRGGHRQGLAEDAGGACVDQRCQDIVFHVEPYNPVLQLYRRFGLETMGDNGIHIKLRCRLPNYPSCTADFLHHPKGMI